VTVTVDLVNKSLSATEYFDDYPIGGVYTKISEDKITINDITGWLYLDRVTGRLSIVVWDDPFKRTTIYSEFEGMCKPAKKLF
jgi:hypothetical protein